MCMPAGQEPYRQLGIRVNTEPSISLDECKLVLETQDVFWKYYIEVLPLLAGTQACCFRAPQNPELLGCRMHAHRSVRACEVAHQKVNSPEVTFNGYPHRPRGRRTRALRPGAAGTRTAPGCRGAPMGRPGRGWWPRAAISIRPRLPGLSPATRSTRGQSTFLLWYN